MWETRPVTQAAAQTGVGPATVVAIEQHYPPDQRLVHDDLVGQILPWQLRLYVWLMRSAWIRAKMLAMTQRRAPGVWDLFTCRKRYIERTLAEALSDQPPTIQAVVNLGAGFDTLVYRLDALADIPVWEVDQPVNIDAKRSGLRRARPGPTGVTLVPVDFDHQDLATELAGHSYQHDGPTFFILEAVSQYLTQAGIQATFGFLAKAKPGSRLVFTYVREDFIEGRDFRGLEPLHRKLVVDDKMWLFGLDPERVSEFLDRYGWRLVEDMGCDALAERYAKATGRALDATGIERVVHAEKR